MIQATVNRVSEWSFTSHRSYADPFNEIRLDLCFTAADGRRQQVPAFWAGQNRWTVRFAPPSPGTYRWESICSDSSNADLHGRHGELVATAYQGSNPLYAHGGLTVMPDRRHLQHTDGKPFLWLADTWWMSFCERLSYPEEFSNLIHDRVQKGFNVVQIVTGLYPDMPWYDERGRNEAGFPWDKNFNRINPDYFDMADLRIAKLIDAGLVPCLVGSWGYFMDFAGMDVLKKHWRYLVARYAGYPVVWCTAGEALMDFYVNQPGASDDPEARKQKRQEEWSTLIRHIRELDSYHRPITIHPTQFGREQLSDPKLIDFEMLQTGHSGECTLGPTIDMLTTSLSRDPKMPVLVSEVNYEGICETNREEIQRFLFWTCLLSGAMGHTYGANGLWQLNTPEKPYGPSPHGTSWGNLPWDQAAQLPGSKQIGLAKKCLEKYPWWQIETHPEWISHPQSEGKRTQCYIAGIPRRLRIVFIPSLCSWIAWQGALKILNLEEDVTYCCTYFDPKTGDVYGQGTVTDREYTIPKPPIFQDWVIILEAVI
jgi:hypothetical protein